MDKDHQGNTELRWAVWKGDAARVSALIAAGKGNRCKNFGRFTDFQVAIIGGVPGIPELFIGTGFEKGENGESLLGWCVCNASQDTVSRLLEAGEDPREGIRAAMSTGGKKGGLVIAACKKKGVAPDAESFISCGSATTARAWLRIADEACLSSCLSDPRMPAHVSSAAERETAKREKAAFKKIAAKGAKKMARRI